MSCNTVFFFYKNSQCNYYTDYFLSYLFLSFSLAFLVFRLINSFIKCSLLRVFLSSGKSNLSKNIAIIMVISFSGVTGIQRNVRYVPATAVSQLMFSQVPIPRAIYAHPLVRIQAIPKHNSSLGLRINSIVVLKNFLNFRTKVFISIVIV